MSPVTHALVTILVPANFNAAREWPVLIVNATSVPQYHSSGALLRAYAEAALEQGWIALAADPAEEVAVEQDDAVLRYALDKASLGALESQWRAANRARLAFAGFSAGAKYSGWLAAAFARRAGLSNVRIEYFAGPHVVHPRPLRIALEWFLEVAGQTTSSR